VTAIISDPKIFKITLIVIGVICIAAIYFASRKKEARIERGAKKAKGPLLLLHLDKEGPPLTDSLSSQPPEDAGAEPSPVPHAPAFATPQRRPWVLADLFRALLIILSMIVAAGFVLILLPQPTIDKMAQDLRARDRGSQQEKIAFLYLGDQIENNEFRVRGVIRNITTTPIDQLDAAVRFFSHDGNVLETTVVRMNKETIAPDETAQFELVYPDYKMQFASYAVEFKLRQGDLVPYKDMRTNRAQSN